MKTARQYFFRRYGLTALLGTFAVASLGVIGFETDWGYALRSAAKSAGAARKAEMVAMLPAFTLTPLETGYRESGERPLFLPTRRPVLATAVSQVVMKKGQFKLTGTSIAPDLSVAYLQEVSSGKTIRVTKGLEINGIKLDVVEASRVVLKQGDDSEELTLRTAASPPRPPTPATSVGSVVAGASGAIPATTGPAAAFMPGVASAAQTQYQVARQQRRRRCRSKWRSAYCVVPRQRQHRLQMKQLPTPIRPHNAGAGFRMRRNNYLRTRPKNEKCHFTLGGSALRVKSRLCAATVSSRECCIDTRPVRIEYACPRDGRVHCRAGTGRMRNDLAGTSAHTKCTRGGDASCG